MSKRARIIAIGLMVASLSCYAEIKHEVKRGETLWGLSHKYNVTPEAITKLNPKAEKGLKTGMILTIPEPGDDAAKSGNNSAAPKAAEQLKAAEKTTAAEKPKAEAAPSAPEAKASEAPAVQPAATAEAEVVTEEPAAAFEIPVAAPVTAEEIVKEGLYQALFGDTFKSIAAKTGVPEADLEKYNPLIDPDHLSEGYMVRLTQEAPYVPYALTLSAVDSIIYRIEPQVTFNNDVASQGEVTIAVMLPFDLDNEVIAQKSLLATEFYKGFLMATQKATDDRKLPVRIIAIDTQCDSTVFDQRLRNLGRQRVSIIIPPDDEVQLSKIEDFALDHNIVVYNVLNIKDEGYITHPNVIQCNISQKQMYDKAIQMLLRDFSDYTPVILDLAGGKDEKMSFIDQLNKHYEAQGRNVINLSFKNKLEKSDLSSLNSNGKYILIPKSGTSDVFSKISDTLTEVVEEDLGNDRYAIFGYPDWIAFRGENEEALHRMGANIYSRFYYDSNDMENEEANQLYRQWYGGTMEEVFPSQGLLGYDAGNLLYKAIKKKYDNNIINKFATSSHDGVQSAFRFTKEAIGDTETSGIINDSLYIIEYLPGQALLVKTI